MCDDALTAEKWQLWEIQGTHGAFIHKEQWAGT